MLKHIREAIKQSGVDPKEVQTLETRSGHIYLIVRGHKITVSSSPKDRDTATRSIVRDIRNCLTQV